jgi:hypothetical protein
MVVRPNHSDFDSLDDRDVEEFDGIITVREKKVKPPEAPDRKGLRLEKRTRSFALWRGTGPLIEAREACSRRVRRQSGGAELFNARGPTA